MTHTARRPTGAWLAALWAASSPAGCGTGGVGAEEDGAVLDGTNGGDGGAGACPVGSVFFPDGKGGGGCVAVGPQPGKYDALLFGSGDPFAGLETGYPPGVPGGAPIADCPQGTVPTFAASRGVVGEAECAPVGPQGCDPLFIDPETGLCSPRSSDCPEGSVPAFEDGCLDLDLDPATGAGCGEGPWGDLVEAPGDVHVDPSADPGAADGTRDHPWPLVAHALGKVSPGGRIVLAKGFHDAGFTLTKAVTIEGACPSEVSLGGEVQTAGSYAWVVRVAGATEATLRAVTVSGPGIGVLAGGGARVVLERVVVREAAIVGVGALNPGTVLEAHGLRVESTLPHPGTGSNGQGIDVSDGAAVVVTDALVPGNRLAGVSVAGAGSVFEADGLVVEGTLPAAIAGLDASGIAVAGGGRVALTSSTVVGSEGAGIVADGAGSEAVLAGVLVAESSRHGLSVEAGAHLLLDVSVSKDNREVGLLVVGAGSEVDADGLLVESTVPATDGVGGRGIQVQEGARLVARSAAIRENQVTGLIVSGPGTVVDAAGVLVEGTRSHEVDGHGGAGVFAYEGATVALASSVLRENRTFGLLACGPGTEVEASRILVRDTLAQESDGILGRGASVEDGARLVLTSAALRTNQDAGLVARGDGTVLEATGLLVEGTLPEDADGTGGYGVSVLLGARAELESVGVIANREIGLFVDGPETVLEADGLLVEGTLPRAADGFGGWGMAAGGGAHLSATSIACRGNRHVGLASLGEGSEVVADELLVEGTLPNADHGEAGTGLWVQTSASLSIARALVRQNHLAGLLAAGGEVAIADAVFEGTSAGHVSGQTGLADGIAATGAVLSLERVLSRDNLRAGFVFDAVTGTAKGLVSTGNGYGLVIQGDAAPDFLDDTVLFDNAFDSNDADLPVADEPLPVPDAIAPRDR